MSWHFSQALEAEYLQGSSLDGDQSAQWKSMPTAPDDSCSDKMKGTFHRSPFGTMYVPSTDTHGAALLTWFLAASPAPVFPLPEKRPALKQVKASFGWSKPGSFAKYDHATHTWKTRQCSLIEDLGAFSETWPRWGFMQDGECSALETFPPITNVKGSGLWPTPCHGSSRWGGTFQEVGGSQNKLRNTAIGKLYVNPDFWESLMEWPTGWTGTAPLGTDSILEWQQQHSPFFPIREAA
jgi:hypothetical protein